MMADWIIWTGGQCPAVGQKVEIQTRKGEWADVKADEIIWEHRGSQSDVVAYRPVAPCSKGLLARGYPCWRCDTGPCRENETERPLIQAAFVEAYLNALPDGWAKDESSMNAVLGRAIATGLAAAIERWEKR